MADAIVEALQLGIVDVWVPKSGKRTNFLATMLPRPLSEGMARAIKADRVLTGADPDMPPRATSCAQRARSPGSRRRPSSRRSQPALASRPHDRRAPARPAARARA